MKRRNIEIFNLSFLDILSGALGAVLFLFIVVPKGGESPSQSIQLSLTLDTVYQKAFGILPDSLLNAQAGDTLKIIVKDFGTMPQVKDCPPPKKCPKCPEVKTKRRKPIQTAAVSPRKVTKTPKPTVKKPSRPSTAYKGDLPSVPCKFSVEVKWEDIKDNVDLFVCKDGSCVYGGKRKRAGVGFWDSGKSKTSFFGSDLRTTQEAVRQFDAIIPGTYEVYLQYKASESQTPEATISGLVYTKNEEGQEQGETFDITLNLNRSDRTHVGTIQMSEDGSFTFDKR